MNLPNWGSAYRVGSANSMNAEHVVRPKVRYVLKWCEDHGLRRERNASYLHR
jgi:hypothetical protein